MKSKKVFVYLLVTGLIITGVYAGKNSFLLKTQHAPFGIISFELCFSNAKQATLLKEWKVNYAYQPQYSSDSLFTRKAIYALPTAVTQTYYDFAFIFFYTALFSLLIFRGQKFYVGFLSNNVAIWVVILAGVMDCIENIFELSSMHLIANNVSNTGLALLVAIPSSIKWISLVFSLVYYYIRVLRPHQKTFLENKNILLRSLIRQLWNFRIVIIGLLLLFAMLNLVDQGQDLLVAINSSGKGIFWFILVIFVLAVLNWYLPKVYDNSYHTRTSKGLKETFVQNSFQADDDHIKRYISRTIGSATLVIPATGLLTAMKSYHIGYFLDTLSPFLVLVLIIFSFVKILRYNFFDRFFMKTAGSAPKANPIFNEKLYWIIFSASITLIILLAFLAGNHLPTSLPFLALNFILLSYLFLLTVNYREQFKHDLPFIPILFVAAGTVFLLFILFNIRNFSAMLTENDRFFSLPVFIAGLVFYTIALSILLLLGRKFKLQFISILIAVTMYISLTTITEFHKVNIITAQDPIAAKNYTLRAYTHDWLESRRAEISGQSLKRLEYPVFFVNAHGGGIKAAAWTTMVVGRLNQLMKQETLNSLAFPDYEHYVFSFSGASGGTIGLSLLAGARLAHQNDPLNDNLFSDTLARKVYQHDYLTDDIVGVLGRDAWMGSLGLNLYADRAKVTEGAWEKYVDKLGVSYDTPLSRGWRNPKMEVPLFVSNTYDIDMGIKAVLAPVKLSQADFPGVLLIQKLLNDKQDIRLSSAAFLSARFPYVSPTGKFDENHHFTDGGTIENSGAETSLQLIRVFKTIIDSLTGPNGKVQDTIFKKVRICLLSIPNSIPQMDSVERVRNVYETGAPVAGILQSVDGNAKKAEAVNVYTASNSHWLYYKMYPKDEKIKNGSVHPILPLGWQISDYALEMMELSVKRKETALDTIMIMFRSNFKKNSNRNVTNRKKLNDSHKPTALISIK